MRLFSVSATKRSQSLRITCSGSCHRRASTVSPFVGKKEISAPSAGRDDRRGWLYKYTLTAPAASTTAITAIPGPLPRPCVSSTTRPFLESLRAYVGRFVGSTVASRRIAIRCSTVAVPTYRRIPVPNHRCPSKVILATCNRLIGLIITVFSRRHRLEHRVCYSSDTPFPLQVLLWRSTLRMRD